MTASPCDHVLMIAPPGFLADYVSAGIRRAGLAVTGPLETAGQLECGCACRAAVIDVAIAPRELLMAVELLTGDAVPFVLIGSSHACSPNLLKGWPVLMQPFASFEVVERLCAAGMAVPG